ncbi:MAG TPA: hypothetical protein VKZ60_13050 [Chloroflexota bacterium]|jgi:hypothetical protein|nr:hypothetical protein [Chloroflexota bacterium]
MKPDITEDIHPPALSVWPAVLGAGITLLAFGLLTSSLFCAVGVLTIVGGLVGWIGELRHA